MYARFLELILPVAALALRLAEGLEVIRDAGGTTTDEGLACNGSWCAEQARALLAELEG